MCERYEMWYHLCVVCFFFSSRRRHTRCREVSWARRCVQETVICWRNSWKTGKSRPVIFSQEILHVIHALILYRKELSIGFAEKKKKKKKKKILGSVIKKKQKQPKKHPVQVIVTAKHKKKNIKKDKHQHKCQKEQSTTNSIQ
eukprot:TRINITY_DN27251_c0_g1_i2.p1 TRINITY_DN27251_c0_g1~~TRINITY_DN27251_c0_g1_i2.p1  ORF type:complete len:153 (-),score=42.72 TRINITY_DN27251_c0_g1_i2:10-438(-)